MKNFKILTLPNGVRVLLVPRPESYSAFFAVAVGVGANKEKPAEAGLAHFLEHLHFDGTVGHRNAIVLQEAFDLLGADNNGYTNYFSTVFHASASAEKILATAKLVSETFFDSLFKNTDIAKEKKVVGEEVKRSWDNPDNFCFFKLRELMYGQLPAGRPVLGAEDTIKNFNRKRLLAFKKEKYQPTNTLIIVAGNFKQKEVLTFIKHKFGGWVGSGLVVEKSNDSPYDQIKFLQPKIVCYRKEIDQIKLRIGFPAPKIGQTEEFATGLISAILAGGLNSRLYKILRHKLGAAYGVSAWHDAQADYGAFVIAGGFDAGKIEIVLKTIFVELRRLTRELVSAKELNLVKTKIISWLLLGLETPEDLASFYGRQITLGQIPKTPEEFCRCIRAVSSVEIKKTAQAIFKKDGLHLVLVGRGLKKEVFAKLVDL